jgi:hypothetical protein
MKVWLVSKDRHRECVVLAKPAESKGYDVEEFTLIGSPEQREALYAQGHVEKLSKPARRKLGITFKHIARLKALAEPKVDIEPGNTVYSSVFFRGGDTKVTGVYTWRPSIVEEMPEALRVWPDLESYDKTKTAQRLAQEIASFPASAKRLMGMKV